MAKTSHQIQQQELQVYVDKSTILTEITKKFYQEWHEHLQRWQDTNAYKNYVNNTICIKKTINDLDITRCWNIKDTILYLKLITGYYMDPAFLYKIKKRNTSQCTCNRSLATLEHIIFSCTLLQTSRNRIFQIFDDLHMEDNIKLRSILSSRENLHIKTIIDFINLIKLNI